MLHRFIKSHYYWTLFSCGTHWARGSVDLHEFAQVSGAVELPTVWESVRALNLMWAATGSQRPEQWCDMWHVTRWHVLLHSGPFGEDCRCNPVNRTLQVQVALWWQLPESDKKSKSAWPGDGGDVMSKAQLGVNDDPYIFFSLWRSQVAADALSNAP